jgi:hypothetical protein
MIIYLAGSFFIYIYGEQLENSEWKKIKHLPLVFYIIRALFFSVAIFVSAKSSAQRNQPIKKTIPYLDIT